MEVAKIRFTMPFFIYEIIENDIRKFGINKNKLSNIIFEHFKYNYVEFTESSDKNSVTFQFNLNKDNTEEYRENYSEFFNDKINTQAMLFRALFYTYVNQPADKREIIIYKKNYDCLLDAVKEKKRVKIKYLKEFRTIEPFFVSSTKEERYNYVCCYCYKNEKIVNYRLSKIEKVIKSNKVQSKRDEEKIKKYKRNFDPYLSFGRKVKIRLTAEGIKLYGMFTITPKILEKYPLKDGGAVYVVEASDLKAKLFFPQFMDEVEIMEPLSLREWFKKKIDNMKENYR